MRTITEIFRADAAALIGRDVCGLADDLTAVEREDNPDCDALAVAEIHAAIDMLGLRASTRLAPTPARLLAVELSPVVAMSCANTAQVDDLLEKVRDWIDGLGDPVRTARRLHGLRMAAREIYADPETGLDEIEETGDRMVAEETAASLEVRLARNAVATFEIHDATTLVAVLRVRRRLPMIVGMVTLDEDGGARIRPFVPQMAV